MARFVQTEVETRRQNPTAGERITVVLGVVSGHSATVKERVTEVGGDIQEELPYNSLLVDLPETELDVICGLSEIESIELDEGMEILSGN